MSVYKHILVGLDLSSEESSIVLRKAMQLAKTSEAKLSVAHIVEPLTFAYGGDIPIDMVNAQQKVEEQANQQLQRLLDENNIDESDAYVSVGQTSTELHHLAKKSDADLIVVGCHGRHGLALLFGSTANGVLHGTHCDVLAVKV